MNKKAEEVIKLFDASNGIHRQEWLSNFQKCIDFTLGDQLTAEELKDLQEAGMPDFVINMIRPAVDVVKYFATANNPRWKAVGVEESDVDVANVHNALISFRWNACNGQSLYSTAIEKALMGGLGLLHVYVDSDLDNGKGEVCFEAPDPFDFFVDVKSSDILFRDATYMGFRKIFSRATLKRMFPQYKSRIERASASTNIGEDYSERDTDESMSIQRDEIQEAYDEKGKETDLLDYFMVYFKDRIPYYNVFYRIIPDSDELEAAKEKINEEIQSLEKELSVQMLELKTYNETLVQAGKMLPERAQLELENFQKRAMETIQAYQQQYYSQLIDELSRIENKVVTEEEYKILMKDDYFKQLVVESIRFFKPRIRYRITVGDKFLKEDYFDSKITEYPVIPIMFFYTGTVFPMGFVSMLIGKQREMNKSHQITIHNANLGSSLRWLHKRGTTDIDYWEKYSSSAGAHLVYSGDQPPIPIMPMQLNNAFFELTLKAKQDFWDLAGIYPHQQGDISLQHDMPHKGILAVDEFGTRRVRVWMKNMVEPALQQLGVVFKQFCQSVYTSNKVFRIVQPSALQDDDADPKFEEYEINIPIYSDMTGAVNKAMNYSDARFDVMIVPGSTEPVNRWAQRAEFFDYYRAGAIDDIAFILNSDIPGKNDIIKRNSMYSKMMAQIKQLEGEVKSKNGDIETLHRQVMQMGIRDKIRDAELSIKDKQLKTEVVEEVARKEMQSTLESVKVELQNMLRNFGKELALIKKEKRMKESK